MSSSRRMRKTPFVLAVVVLVLAVSANGFAGRSGPTKPYRAVLSPASVAAGSQDLTLTLYNDSNQQQLGSADLTAPSSLPITGIVAPAGSSFTVGVASLRNLAIPPGSTLAVTITVLVPCSTGSFSWSIVAKQANDFNGSGNDFVLSTSGSSLTTSVTASCVLAFVAGRQPSDAEKNATISSVAFTPSGNPVQVEVQDGSGNRVTSSAASITVAIDPTSPNPGSGAILSGTKTVTASSGVATFSTLAINVHGTYRLLATSPGITQASSSAFTIWDAVSACTGGESCSTLVSENQTMSSNITATSVSNGFLLTSLDIGATLPCNDSYNHAPGVTTIDSRSLTGTTKSATITIDKSFVQATPNNGVAFYQVCYESDTTFVGRDGSSVSPGTAALLPDCSSQSPVPPCVRSKSKTNAGDVVIVVDVPLSDPRLW